MLLFDRRLPVTEAKLEYAQIPKRFWALNPSEITDKEALEVVTNGLSKVPEWLKNSEGVLVMGRFLAGKTVFACMLAREVLSFSGTVLFVPAYEIPEIWLDKMDEDRTVCAVAKSVDLLVIDDLGAEPKGTGTTERRIEFTVRSRYENCKMTVITTNMAISEIKKRYDDALVSVFRRTFTTTVVLKNAQFVEALK